jgi:hypothetical protein
MTVTVLRLHQGRYSPTFAIQCVIAAIAREKIRQAVIGLEPRYIFYLPARASCADDQGK